MIEKPSSWLSNRREELYESRKLLTKRKVSTEELVTGLGKFGKFGIEVWQRIVWWNVLGVVFLHVAREYIPHPEPSEMNGIETGPWEVFFSVFGIIYAIIVGMLIVEALRRFNDLTSTTEQEINAVEDIRDFLVYLDDGDEARPAIRASLRTYVNSVVKDEWPNMISIPEKMDSDTSPQLYQLMEAVREIRAKEGASKVALESIINKIAEVTTYRTERIEKSAEYIKFPMRLLIIGLSIAVAGGLALMFIEPFWLHLVMMVVTVTAMATLYELVSDLNHPYAEGELWTINSGSFKKLEERLGTVEITRDDVSEQRHITEEFHVSVADQFNDWFRVKLCNPSADFRCSEIPSISDQSVVNQKYHEFVPAPREKQETPDEEVWTFEALKKGETWISMQGHKSEESGAKAEWTFTLKVVVK